ncbi:MAG: hypothetical protein M1825_002877 [Sarcosagium campestre]|nr:MAG: hypothetical protein M1825_002877 [Sarcosagium campestre]
MASPLCGVCSTPSPPCSVHCYKSHKTTHNAPSQGAPGDSASAPSDSTKFNPAASDSTSSDQSDPPKSLPALFERYPKLRAQLHDIYTSTQPPDPEVVQSDRRETGSWTRGRGWARGRGWGRGRGRGRGYGRGMGRGRGRDEHTLGPWTAEKAERAGLASLARAVSDEEGVREFVAFVRRGAMEKEG